MSEVVDVFKEKFVSTLEEFAEANPPREGGELYLKHLKNKVITGSTITVTEIMKYLARAGYNAEDILKFLYALGLIVDSRNISELKDAARRVIREVEEEEDNARRL